MGLQISQHLKHLTVLIVALLGTTGAIFGTVGGSLGASAACGCEAVEKEALVDNTRTWEVRSLQFHEIPKAAQKRMVTIELVKGGPETITALNANLPANFKITNLNGCEKKYAAGTSCQIEMEFLVAGKGVGTYSADLELVFEKAGNLIFDKVPSGTIP